MAHLQRDQAPLDMAKSILVHVVPEAFLYPTLKRLRTWGRRSRPTKRRPGSTDLQIVPLGEGAVVTFSWVTRVLRVREGKVGVMGPRIRLVVHGEVVMRLDCFGGKHGHWHINPDQVKMLGGLSRLAYPEGTRAEHLERAVFDLEHNARSAIRMNRVPRVRRYPLDEERLAEVARSVRSGGLELIEEHLEAGSVPTASARSAD
jgi:hypothetical protein